MLQSHVCHTLQILFLGIVKIDFFILLQKSAICMPNQINHSHLKSWSQVISISSAKNIIDVQKLNVKSCENSFIFNTF